MQVSSALSSAGPLQYCWVSKLSLILTRHHGEHKWDQPSGENSDKPVSPLFRERRVWWPAKLPQACLGENRGFRKPSSLHSQPRSEQQQCREGPKGEASQWLCLRSVQNYRVSAQRIVPCARPVPLHLPPPTPSVLWTASPSWMNLLGRGIFFFVVVGGTGTLVQSVLETSAITIIEDKTAVDCSSSTPFTSIRLASPAGNCIPDCLGEIVSFKRANK